MLRFSKRQRKLMTLYIGLAGWARSGKDTIANYLVENHGFTKVSFAEPMREALLALDPYVPFGISKIRLSTLVRFGGWDVAKETYPEVRELLQRMGTEVGRNLFGENFWVDQAMKEASKYDKVVFSDCRYMNEAVAIEKNKGLIWRVSRPGVSAVNNHDSEKDLNNYKFDSHFINDSTLAKLHRKIEDRLELLW